MRPASIALALGAVVLLAGTSAESQALRYVDEYGVVHWVNSRDQIPEKYREKVEAPALPSAGRTDPPDACRRANIRARDWSAQAQVECEAWLRSEALERQRRVRELELERARRSNELQQRSSPAWAR